jgi:endonuclease/exonuclease/phosphatase (EEP) superfamily protein YafD
MSDVPGPDAAGEGTGSAVSSPAAPVEMAGAGPSTRRGRRQAEVGAWVGLCGVLGVTLLTRWVTAAPPPLVAAVSVLPAIWLLSLIPAIGLALFSGRRRGWLPAGLLTVGLALVWGRAWIGWSEGADGRPLRVVSWNVQRLGWEDADDGEHLACVSERLADARPDALVFLEVSARDVARLAGRLNLECEHTDYRGTGDERHGGLAVCARGDRWRLARKGPRQFVDEIDWYYVFGEIVHVDSVPASGASDAEVPPDAVVASDAKGLAPMDPAPGDVFNVVAVHLQPYGAMFGAQVSDVAEAQAAETAALLARVSALRDPTVVAGDFNSSRDAPVHVRMRRFLVDTFEQAGWGPGMTVRAAGWLPLRIDYIYATSSFAVHRATTPNWDCSDHRPVLTDLVVRAP